MRRVREGPSIRDFLEYYILVLLTRDRQTKSQLIERIRKESADNRTYRPYGALWVASADMDKTLEKLAEQQLIRPGPRSGKWRITSAGRKARSRHERKKQQGPDSKERAASKVVELVSSKVDNRRVLDIGTGAGFLAFKLAEQGLRVLGVDSGSFDYSKDSIEQAKREAESRGGRVEFRRSDVMALNERPESFDYVVSSQALHCMRDQPSCLQAAYRLLKPGGKFVCMDFSVGLKGFLRHGFHGFLAISAEEWEALLPKCGFEEVQMYPMDDYLVVEAHK